MRFFFLRGLTLLAPAAMVCCSGLAHGQTPSSNNAIKPTAYEYGSYYYNDDDEAPAPPANTRLLQDPPPIFEQPAPSLADNFGQPANGGTACGCGANTSGACTACAANPWSCANSGGCTNRPSWYSSLCGECATCDGCPNRGIMLFSGYDSWRGVSDGAGQNNNGISTGFNYGTRLGRISDLTGVGFQIGGSVGAYDWSGRTFPGGVASNAAQTQGFVTLGFFRKANEYSNWSGGVVNDWMLNHNFGYYAQSPTLSQWRGQIAYAVNAANEFGLWGAVRGTGSTRVSSVGPTSVTYRALDQLNFFWHHKWAYSADTWLWAGIPQENRLSGPGSLGNFIIGGSATIPLNDRFGLYSNFMYMHPSAHPGPIGSTEDAMNITAGLAFYPRSNARSRTVAGQCWMPLMNVANNGSFMVDASHNGSF